MTFETGLIFFISLILMWVKPGPAQLLKIATALDKGFFPAIFISLGSILMCSVFFIVAALGYKMLSTIFEYTGFILQILGAFYLIFIAMKGFIKIYKNSVTDSYKNRSKELSKPHNLMAYLALGVGITLSNPFWIFYFIGVLPALIPLETLGYTNFYLGAFLVFASGVIVDGPMLLLVTQLKQAFASERTTKNISFFINICFVLIALFLFYSAFFVQDFGFILTEGV